MRLYKRGKIWWCQFQGVRFSLKVQDEQAARAAFRDVQRRAVDPSYAPTETVTVEAVCKAWLESLATEGNRGRPPAPGTLRMYGFHAGHFLRIFGASSPLAVIDAAAVDDYIKTRRSETLGESDHKVKAATVSKELHSLKQVLTLATRRGWFTKPLAAVLPANKAPQYVPLTRALDEKQVPKLLKAVADTGVEGADLEGRAAIVAFIVGLAADWVCVGRAEFGDFDLKGKTVLLRGSKNTRRWARVPIVAPFESYVKRAHAYLKAHGRFPAWSENVVRDLAAACKRAKLPRVTPRDLRRTHGRILRARGVPPSLIGGMLRHKDSRMAELVYAQLEPVDLGKLVSEHTGTQTVQPRAQKHRKSR